MVVSVPARRGGSLAAAALAFVCIAPAAYATGLPQQASDTAVAVLAKLGVTPGSHAGGGAGSHGHGASISALARSTDLTGAAKGAAVSALASGGNSHAGAPPSGQGQGHGSQVSALARTTTATGVDKGAAISALASGGRSQAGQHGGPPQDTGTPQVGGTGTADGASGGASSTGTQTANQHSGGHSSAGSGNSGR